MQTSRLQLSQAMVGHQSRHVQAETVGNKTGRVSTKLALIIPFFVIAGIVHWWALQYGLSCGHVVMIDSNPFAYLGRHWEFVPVTMEVWVIGLFLSLSVRIIRDRKFLGILRYEWYLSGKHFFKITPSQKELQVWEGIERRKMKESA